MNALAFVLRAYRLAAEAEKSAIESTNRCEQQG